MQDPMSGRPDSWTVEEVARRLRVHPRTVLRWIAAGKLRSVQPSGPGSPHRILDLELARLEGRPDNPA